MEIFPFAGFLWWLSQYGASVHINVHAAGVCVFLLWIFELLKAQSCWFTLYKMKSGQLALWRKVHFCRTCQPCRGSTDRWETVVFTQCILNFYWSGYTTLFSCYVAGATWNCCCFGTSFVYTIQPCTSLQCHCHIISNHICRVHVCLALTWHLHFWQNDGYFKC